MNKKRFVWLPPDGDVRLVRFQQELAALVGLINGVAVPPYLELAAPTGRPQGDVRLGPWTMTDGEPVLEAWDDQGPVGVVRFSLVGSPSPLSPPGLPAPPDWRWSRGITAVLEVAYPSGDPSFVLWSWSSRRGWKSALPRG